MEGEQPGAAGSPVRLTRATAGEGAALIVWAPKVSPGAIRRLYATDARGIVDSDLITEVGASLVARCESILAASSAYRQGIVRCPVCSGEVPRTQSIRVRGQVLACSACGWATTWGLYFDSFSDPTWEGQIRGGPLDDFAAFCRAFRTAGSARDRLLAIDRLINAFHSALHRRVRRSTRPAGAQLIEGTVTEVVDLLDEISATGALPVSTVESERRADSRSRARFGDRLRSMRREAHLTGPDLARRAGTTAGVVCQIEIGLWASPAAVERIARELGASPEEVDAMVSAARALRSPGSPPGSSAVRSGPPWVHRLDRTDAGPELLGAKGHGLARMARMGLPVPPGFVVATSAGRVYLGTGTVPEGLWDEVREAVRELEGATGRRFGDRQEPLLVSVRSGAERSMPGMMETVLNVGLSADLVPALASSRGDERAAVDARRRLLEQYASTVHGAGREPFEREMARARAAGAVSDDHQLPLAELRRLTARLTEICEAAGGLPDDPWRQLEGAVLAVFRSWNSPRARAYREIENIPADLGTAVTVQAMVLGSLSDRSGAGVAVSREPVSGERGLWGDFLPGAQGVDVVGGVAAPRSMAELFDRLPDVHDHLGRHLRTLERRARCPQEVEFTVERGHLFLLQSRPARLSAAGEVRAAVDMVDEGLISESEAAVRVDLDAARLRDRRTVDVDRAGPPLTSGVPASAGVATGLIALDPRTAVSWADAGRPVVLVRAETSSDDVEAMAASRGLLTRKGGAASHGALVSRALGVPCVAGAGGLEIDLRRRLVTCGTRVLREGEEVTVDGTRGTVHAGAVPCLEVEDAYVERILRWRRDVRAEAGAGPGKPHVELGSPAR